jgi:hypothetical protein
MSRPRLSGILASVAVVLVGVATLDAFKTSAREGSAWLKLVSLGVLLVPLVIFALAVIHAWDLRERGLRRAAWGLVLVLAVAAAWGYYVLRGQVWASDLGLRARISRTVGLEAFRSWAIGLLDHTGTNEGLAIRVRDPRSAELVPPAIRSLGPTWVHVETTRNGHRFVRVEFGGGFHQYGVEIGHPSFRPESSYDRFRWQAGVYGYER